MKTNKKAKRKGWKLIRDSFHKMLVTFDDGTQITRYSVDWRHAYSKNRDPNIGFENYRKLMRKWGEKAKKIVIYNRASDTIVAKYYEGDEIDLDDDP